MRSDPGRVYRLGAGAGGADLRLGAEVASIGAPHDGVSPIRPLFGDFAQLAAQLCRAPFAYLSLHGRDGPQIVTRFGFGSGGGTLERALRSDGPDASKVRVVADLAADERTRGHPLVKAGFSFRFYASTPVLGLDGQPWGALCVLDTAPREGLDLAERTGLAALARQVTWQLESGRTHREQDVLASELQHRLKNTFALVHGIVNQAFRDTSDLRGAKAALETKLLGLSAVHGLIETRSSAGVSLGQVLSCTLGPYDGKDRVRLNGQDVSLDGRSALAMALVAHELATNAMKYGALSADAGVIEVDWHLSGESSEVVLSLAWRELGGPTISRRPTHRGFGSRLIERTFEGQADFTMTYEPSGLVFQLRAPLTAVDGCGRAVAA